MEKCCHDCLFCEYDPDVMMWKCTINGEDDDYILDPDITSCGDIYLI